ncbi:MAG: hypothetical protein O2857_02220, partial [Planctomycetota bacterium]|nr:hypothetical protein [Planctomycetota bacterium]
ETTAFGVEENVGKEQGASPRLTSYARLAATRRHVFLMYACRCFAAKTWPSLPRKHLAPPTVAYIEMTAQVCELRCRAFPAQEDENITERTPTFFCHSAQEFIERMVA